MSDFFESNLFSPTAPSEIKIKEKQKQKKKKYSIKLTYGEHITNEATSSQEFTEARDEEVRIEIQQKEKPPPQKIYLKPIRKYKINSSIDDISLVEFEEINYLAQNHSHNNRTKIGSINPAFNHTDNLLSSKMFRENLSSDGVNKELIIGHIPKSYIKCPLKYYDSAEYIIHQAKKSTLQKDIDRDTNWVPQFYSGDSDFFPITHPLGKKIQSKKRNSMMFLFDLMMSLKSKLRKRAKSDENILVDSEMYDEEICMKPKKKTKKKKKRMKKPVITSLLRKPKQKKNKDGSNEKKKSPKRKVLKTVKKRLKKGCHYLGLGAMNMSGYFPQTYYMPSRFSPGYDVRDVHNTNNLYFF